VLKIINILSKFKSTLCGHLLIALIIVYCAGFIGFFFHLNVNGSTVIHSIFLAGYRSLQLFVLNADLSDLAKANLFSQFAVWLAAFLAPAIGFAAIIRIYSRQFQFFLSDISRPREDHVVICGLGEVGIEIYRSLAKERVVIVDTNPEQPWIQECLKQGAGVIIGDALDLATMKHAHMEAAKAIYLVLASDDLNLEATIKISRYLKENCSGACRTTQIWPHVSKPTLIERLEHYLEFQDKQAADVRFFNLYSLTARKFLRDYPPDVHTMIRNASRAHLVFFGFGVMGRKMAVEAAKLCHFRNASRLKVTVFDVKPQAGIEFLASWPGFESICDFEFIHHQFPNDLCSAQCLERIPADATQLIITFGDDTKTAGFALSLREHLLRRPGGNVPVFVRLKHIRGAGSLLTADTHGLPDCLHPFGMLKTILGFSTDFRHEEVFAERIHTLSYLVRVTKKIATGNDENKLETLTPWEQLPHFLRESNRLVVEHLFVKLRAIRHTMVEQPASGPQASFQPYIIPGFGQGDAPASDLEIELARTEKMRWNAERILTGWTYGTRANLAKQHDNLLSWEEMEADDELRKKLDHDKDITRNMAGIVDGSIALNIQTGARQDIKILGTDIKKSLGKFQVRPLHIIGVMAPPKKNAVVRDGLVRDIDVIVERIRRRHPRGAFVVWSTLVTPEERLVADAAMNALGADIQMVLPLYYKVLTEKFGSSIIAAPSPSPSLQDLLRNADARKANFIRVFELPFRCSLAQSCVEPSACKEQYDWLASFFVHHCDDLILFQDDANDTSKNPLFPQTDMVQEWWKQPEFIPKKFSWRFAMHLPPARFSDQGQRQEAFVIANHP